MIKLISENKWYVTVGSGYLLKEYIVDAADNSVSKSTMTSEQIATLPSYLPDVALVGTIINAVQLADTRISNKAELEVLAGHFDLVNLMQYEG
jgi:hypothetical protein